MKNILNLYCFHNKLFSYFVFFIILNIMVLDGGGAGAGDRGRMGGADERGVGMGWALHSIQKF